MIRGSRDPRPRPRSLWSGAFFVLVLGAAVSTAGSAPAAAQIPDSIRRRPPPEAQRPGPPRDTVPRDTVDTIPAPPPALPVLRPVPPELSDGTLWVWDRDDLLRLPDLSVLHLLERIPGLVPIRGDVANQPEAAAVFGAAGGAIRYVIDGFVIDPLVTPTFDPTRLSLLALEQVRIRRGLTGTTVWLETLAPEDPEPKTVIEAGTGDFDVNVFRGIFLGPRVLNGALGLGFERLSADGTISGGSSNHNVTWLKWSWARESSGVQIEYRQSTMDRLGVEEGFAGTRRDWAVRARTGAGAVTSEAYVGGTSVEDELGGEGGTVLRESTPQAGLRFAWSPGSLPVHAEVAGRFRDHPRLPGQELEARLGTRPVPWAGAGVEVLQGWWSEGDPTGRAAAHVELGPLLGLRGFAEVERGGPLLGDGPTDRFPAPASPDVDSRVVRDGSRLGARYDRGSFSLSGAALRLTADTTLSFGVPVEPQLVAGGPGEATGFEITTTIPTGFEPLNLHAWYVGMTPPGDWLYLPEEHWRASLVYHHRPLPSGNLEIFSRIEHVFRGAMMVPGSGGDGAPPLERSDAYRATNFELVIRVLTVRAFLRWNNLFNRREQADIPAFELPGQHIFWGVKWEFWN